MDGNGRWANEQGRQRLFGHNHGVDSLEQVVNAAAQAGVRYLTIYAFSTENWGRPGDEVEGLMNLLAHTIVAKNEPLTQAGVEMNFIGDLGGLPGELRQSIARARENRPAEPRMTLTIALNYSARHEIIAAARNIAQQALHGEINPQQITEQTVADSLYTAGMPDPDLLIRTSGEQRLSNFMLWQLSYAELYFTPVLWPDFGAAAFAEAIAWYQTRQRRFGAL